MNIKFYGTRGSIPVCDKEYQEFGGNTPCVLVQTSSRLGILDAGTGIRNLGKDLLKCEEALCNEIYIAFSHFHWDHIQGFPFFSPAYDKTRRIVLTAIGMGAKKLDLQEILSGQMRQEYFPIPMEQMGAKMNFLNINSDEFSTSSFLIKTVEHNHPGGAHSYRIEVDGKTLVYCTDVEHPDGIDQRVVEIARDADVLIHDAQYTPEELESKKGWGHSSYTQAIEVAKLAKVKKLILTHHDPDHTDFLLSEIEMKCKDLFDDVCLAKEGLEIEI